MGPDPEGLRRLGREHDVDRVHLGDLAAAQPEPGNGDEVVEDACRSVARAVQQHEAAGAGTSQRALGDPRDEGGRDAGVDRGPALGEDLRAGFGGEGMTCGDGASHT